MEQAQLIRTETSNQGTFGILIARNKVFRTAEPPWMNNKLNISCVPSGDYECIPKHSTRFGDTFALVDVQARSNIIFHAGNFAGMRIKKLKSDTKGCILLGDSIKTIDKQKVVADSKKSMNRFLNLMSEEPFILHIRWFDELKTNGGETE